MAFLTEPPYAHGQVPRVGVVLCNLGTPDAPTPAALRRYLAEFLSDPRVVEISRIVWWPLLHGVILHGEQYTESPRREQAGTYYAPSSGIGLAIEAKQQQAVDAYEAGAKLTLLDGRLRHDRGKQGRRQGTQGVH